MKSRFLMKTAAVAAIVSFSTPFGSLAAAATTAAQQRTQTPRPIPPDTANLDIGHDQLVCVITELAPQVDAEVSPGPELQRGYVYFRAVGTEDYYYVLMQGVPENLAGTLPRPLPETKAIDYNIQALDRQEARAKVGDYTPPVVPGNACKEKRGVAVGKDGANLTIGLTKPGQNPLPPGFNVKDIARVILVTGAVVGVAEALSQSAGASSSQAASGTAKGAKTGYVIGGILAAGGVAAIIAQNDGGPSSQATSTPTRTPTPIPLRFVEGDATWSGEGDIEVQILNAANQSVGTKVAAGCGSTALRTERVLYQPAGGIPPGVYRLMLSAASCGPATPASIVVSATVQSETGPKCSGSIVNVPVGGTVQACQFSVP